VWRRVTAQGARPIGTRQATLLSIFDTYYTRESLYRQRRRWRLRLRLWLLLPLLWLLLWLLLLFLLLLPLPLLGETRTPQRAQRLFARLALALASSPHDQTHSTAGVARL
jgi:hypothetical protein